jgi:hypothetical protein
LMSLMIFSPRLLRVPVVCLIFYSSVVTDEARTLSYQIPPFGPISAEVRQCLSESDAHRISWAALPASSHHGSLGNPPETKGMRK